MKTIKGTVLLMLVLYALGVKGQQKELMIPYKVGNLFGYCDKNKNILIKPQFDEAGFFREDNNLYYANGKIDGKDILVLEDGSYIADDSGYGDPLDLDIYSESYYTYEEDPELSKNGYHGFKCDNETESVLIAPIYARSSEIFNEGKFGIFKLKETGKWGVINTTGEIFIPFEYEFIEIYNREKKLFLAKKGSRNGIVDITNEIIYPFEIDPYAQKSNDRLLISKNGLYGYLDDEGKIVIPPKYRRAGAFGKSPAIYGFAYVVNEKGISFFIDKRGTEYYEE